MFKKISLSLLALLSITLTIRFSLQLYETSQHENLRTQALSTHTLDVLTKTYSNVKTKPPKEITKALSSLPLSSAYAALLTQQTKTIIAGSNSGLSNTSLKLFFHDAPAQFKALQTFYSEHEKSTTLLNHERNACFQLLISIKRLPSNKLLIIAIKDSAQAYLQFLEKQRKQLFFLCVTIGVSLILLTLLLTKQVGIISLIEKMTAIYLSIIISTLTFLALMIILILLRLPNSQYTKVNRLENQHLITQEVTHYLKQHSDTPLTLLPFGMHILHLGDPLHNKVSLSVITWHKKVLDQEGKMLHLFFDQKISGEPTPIESSKGWKMSRYGDLTLKQSFNPARYPFDDRFIAIQIWHSRLLNQHIFLYPALDDATLTSIRHFIAPQIAQSASLSDWDIVESYYGILDATQPNPVKHFKLFFLKPTSKNLLIIVLRRDFTGPLIEHFLPLLVVIIMFYFGLSIFDRSTIWQRLTYNGSLLFIITVAATHAYNTVGTNKTNFLVMSYLIVYIMIFLFTGMKLLHFHINKTDEIKFDMSHPIKWLFWPTFTGAMLINTIIYFW